MPNEASNNLKHEEEFKLVTYKNKTSKKPTKISQIRENHTSEAIFDKTKAIRRILQAKEEIKSSDFYESVTASLREALKALGGPEIKEIICYGLGKFGECMISRYQFALLLLLGEFLKSQIHAFDPIFGASENTLLKEFELQQILHNTEGKFKINSTTLFFLPHCPKQLTNNLLWANWGLQLSNCVIVANSFNKILESNSKREVGQNAGYLLNISPYVCEIAVINCFKFYEIFNDLAIHIFPPEKLSLISSDIWEDCAEPNYISDDIEFITNKIRLLK